jgi:thiamine-monophosphate kinase
LAVDSRVGFVLEEHAILAAGGEPLLRAAALLGTSALDLALYVGEDYALVVASPSPLDGVGGFVRIGELTELAEDAEARLSRSSLRRKDGALSPLVARGFDHFRVQLS